MLNGVSAPVRNGIGFGAGLLKDTFDRIPLVSDIAEQSVPEAVEDVRETAPGARLETRANRAAELAKRPETVAKGVVRAQGEVRGAVVNATKDVADAVRGNSPVKVNEEVAKASTTVTRGYSDTATKAVKDVRQSAKDAREAAKDRTAADDE